MEVLRQLSLILSRAAVACCVTAPLGVWGQSPVDQPQPLPPVNMTTDPFLQAASFQAGLPSVPEQQEAQGLDELTRRIEALETQLEEAEEAEKEAKAKAAERPTVRVRGRIHTDLGFFSQEPENILAVGDIEDGANFRRARIGVEGKFTEVTEWILEFDAATGEIALQDAWVGVTELPYLNAVRVGHFREPYSLEAQTSTNQTTFVERALPNAFDPARNWGAASFNWNEAETATWAYGVFRTSSDEVGADVGDDGEWAFTTRATWLPYYDEPTDGRYLTHFGGSYSFRDADEDLVRFRAQPEVQIFAEGEGRVPFFVDTLPIAAERFHLFGAEYASVMGPLSLQSEFMASSVNQIGGDAAFFHGAYAFVSYFLTGEHRPYRRARGSFEPVQPFENFFHVRTPWGFCTGTGAWEVAARWSYIDLTDDAIQGGRLHDLTFGVNWYLNQYVRVQSNYVHAMLDDPVFDESDADIWVTRFIAFW